MSEEYKMDNCLIFDVDQTIADSVGYDYANAKPFKKIINVINKLYAQGVFIIMHTARYYRKFDGNLDKIYEAGYNELKDWLDKHGVRYNRIVMGKPSGRYFIDDRAWPWLDDESLDRLCCEMETYNRSNWKDRDIISYTRDMEL